MFRSPWSWVVKIGLAKLSRLIGSGPCATSRSNFYTTDLGWGLDGLFCGIDRIWRTDNDGSVPLCTNISGRRLFFPWGRRTKSLLSASHRSNCIFLDSLSIIKNLKRAVEYPIRPLEKIKIVLFDSEKKYKCCKSKRGQLNFKELSSLRNYEHIIIFICVYESSVYCDSNTNTTIRYYTRRQNW